MCLIDIVSETIHLSEPEDVAEPTMQHDWNIVVPPLVIPNKNTSNEVPIPPLQQKCQQYRYGNLRNQK